MGVSAKTQQVMNFRNTVWGFKNLVGRKFSDLVVQEDAKEFPFEVVQRLNDALGIKVYIHAQTTNRPFAREEGWLIM